MPKYQVEGPSLRQQILEYIESEGSATMAKLEIKFPTKQTSHMYRALSKLREKEQITKLDTEPAEYASVGYAKLKAEYGEELTFKLKEILEQYEYPISLMISNYKQACHDLGALAFNAIGHSLLHSNAHFKQIAIEQLGTARRQYTRLLELIQLLEHGVQTGFLLPNYIVRQYTALEAEFTPDIAPKREEPDDLTWRHKLSTDDPNWEDY